MLEGVGSRPFWSVMIPTHNPRADYLEQTLRSVLQQDAGPDQMQIEVVDDCSPNADVKAMVKAIAGDRVIFSRTPKNLGLAGCWNTCIEHARGEWVHILHQDDFVLPGFYESLRKGAGDPQVGAMFVRHVTVNPSGHWLRISDLQRESPGVLDGWREQILLGQRIECASIVVKRAVYEKIGAFLPELCFSLDWEMWRRISAHYSVWFEPAILACYRFHPSSTTSKLMLEAGDVRDIRKMMDMTAADLSDPRLVRTARQSRKCYALFAIANSRDLLVKGYPRAAGRQVAEAFRLSRAFPVFWQAASLLILLARILGARIKRRFKPA